MTVFKIPAADCLRHLHAIAARHELTVIMAHFDGVVGRGVRDEPGGASTYRWRLTVSGRHGIVYSVAMERASEMPEAVYAAWQAFVSGGVT
jgi:hypothetical protein